MKKILIIEDTEKHMIDARRAAQSFPDIEFTFISSTEELPYGNSSVANFQAINAFNGIITDLHIPCAKGGSEHPNGMLLATIARIFGIPVVIVTDKYHHDADQEWLNQFFNFISPRPQDEEDILFSGHSFFKKDTDKNRPHSLLGRYDRLNPNGEKYWNNAISDIISYWG